MKNIKIFKQGLKVLIFCLLNIIGLYYVIKDFIALVFLHYSCIKKTDLRSTDHIAKHNNLSRG